MTFSERNFRYDLEYRNAIFQLQREPDSFKNLRKAYNRNTSGTASRVNASIGTLFYLVSGRSTDGSLSGSFSYPCLFIRFVRSLVLPLACSFAFLVCSVASPFAHFSLLLISIKML